MLFVWYPKCTTCQRAKKWLDEHGMQYEMRDIKEENPSAQELQEWYVKSGQPLRRFFNTSGLLYNCLLYTSDVYKRQLLSFHKRLFKIV